MLNSCCKCHRAMPAGDGVITQWGIATNLCEQCLMIVTHGDQMKPPPGLLVLKDGFESADDLTNCCKSALHMQQQ